MAKRERIKATFTAAEIREVKRAMKRLHQFAATSTAVRNTILQVVKHIDEFETMVTRGHSGTLAVTSGDQEGPRVPGPDRARAPESTQDRQTVRKKESLSRPPEPSDAVTAIADAIREAEWYGATLPKAETPETYAAKLLTRYKDMTPEDVHDASLWLLNNPGKRKKYLGGFLTNWMRNAGKFIGPPARRPPTHKPYTIKAAPVDPGDDIAGPDLFKHAEIDERKDR
jgi:hypothetical protein